MKLGISTYTYTWAFGVPGYPEPAKPMMLTDLLQLATKKGISVVQLCDNVPLHEHTIPDLVALGVVAQLSGLEIEVGTRGVRAAHLLDYLDIARILGAKLVRTILIEDGERVDIDKAAWDIETVLMDYEEAGVKLAIENHAKHRCSELVQLVQDLASDYVGICLDTVNSFGALECPQQVIKTLSPFTFNLHIKDFKIQRVPHQMGFEVTGTPAGEGALDINRALNAVKQHNPDANAILELWTPYTQNIADTVDLEQQWAERSYANLKEIMQ